MKGKVVEYFDLNKRSPVLPSSLELECPKCSRFTIVEQPVGTYQCISCDFKRDFSSDDYPSEYLGPNHNKDQNFDRCKQDSEEEVNPFPFFLIAGILIVLLV